VRNSHVHANGDPNQHPDCDTDAHFYRNANRDKHTHGNGDAAAGVQAGRCELPDQPELLQGPLQYTGGRRFWRVCCSHFDAHQHPDCRADRYAHRDRHTDAQCEPNANEDGRANEYNYGRPGNTRWDW